MNITRKSGCRRLVCFLALAACGLVSDRTALGQGRGQLVSVAPDSQERVHQLAREVERASSLRGVKDLQAVYAQYAQLGLWNELGGLFADNAEYLTDDRATAKGRAAIVQQLRAELGGAREGFPKGRFHTDFMMQPVVILSYDGFSANGRWSQMAFDGYPNGKAAISGGMLVNDYVKQAGVWKIARIHAYPQFAGDYADGFFALKPDFPLVPYPFTPSQAGRPVPDEPSGADHSLAQGQSLEQSEARIASLNDANQVRNLQNIYGYYVDRKMWSDVADLLAANAVLDIAGQGTWDGPAGIRRALETDGPEGLRRGQVNDHVQMNMVVRVDADGRSATAEGLDLGMLSPGLGQAYWSEAIFRNRYRKGEDGRWRILEIHLYPVMKADYYQGWGKSHIIEPAPAAPHAPDHPSASPSAILTGASPDLALSYPGETQPSQTTAASPAGVAERLSAARHDLQIAKAYDAVENVSNSFGYYLDDTMWDQMAENFAVNGTRPQGPGFYVGHDHIIRAMTQTHWSGPPSPTNPRDHINVHQRLQPVIEISPDGRTAKIRTRLFLYHANQKADGAGTFSSGMYPNETALVEGGVWKMDVGGEIDETYFSSANWKDGWAKPPARGRGGERPAQPGKPPMSGITNTIDFPPDIPRTLYDGFRWKDMQNTNWPDIKPMWFAYRNPISGRTPPFYCTDFLKCRNY